MSQRDNDNANMMPDELEVSQADVKKLAKRRQLAPGWYAFITQGSKQDVSPKKGTLAIQQTYWPLKDPNDHASKSTPTIRNSIWLPVANPKKPGHKAPNTIGLCHSTMRAFEPELCPDYPRNIDGEIMFEGKSLCRADDKSEAAMKKSNAAREKVVGIVTKFFCKEAWKEPSKLDNYVVFGEAYDNGGFMNVRNICAELPEDAELLPYEDWDGGEVEVEAGEEAAAEEADEEPSRAAKGKTTKKAATKKKR